MDYHFYYYVAAYYDKFKHFFCLLSYLTLLRKPSTRRLTRTELLYLEQISVFLGALGFRRTRLNEVYDNILATLFPAKKMSVSL